MTKQALHRELRFAECQCLIWEMDNSPSAVRELAQWEDEYNRLESLVA